MSDERLEILLIENDVSDVRLIRELVGGAPGFRGAVVATATPKDARVTECSTEDASPATSAPPMGAQETGVPEIVGHAFDPFFTTKPCDRGTGLGLSISYGLVRDHGERMTVGSAPDGAARFFVDLPLGTG